MISDDILNKINDETDLVSLVSEYISLERSGKNYRGLCPFHDDNSPSFYVTTDKNIAKCMTCGSGGRPINFLRQIKNISFADAAKELGDKLGIDVFPNQVREVDPNTELYKIMDSATTFYNLNLFNSESGLIVLDYLKKRQISEETTKTFKLGYAPNQSDMLYQYLKELGYKVSDMMKLGLVNQSNDGTYYDFFKNRLIFPITNRYSKVIAFSARALSKNEKSKYINSPETPIFKKTQVLYNLGEASLEIRKLKKVYIFEGFFDVISAYQEGIKNSVATMGTSLTSEHVNNLKQTTDHVVLAFDGDDAGVNSAINHLPNLDSKLKVDVVLIPDKLDPDDYFKQYGGEYFLKLVDNEALDSYQFRYNYYLNKTNFKNANDLKQFQENVIKMLEAAPPAIISLYKNMLAEKLKVNVETIVVNESKPVYEKVLPKKVDVEKLDNRYIIAEQRLLILMLRSPEWSERLSLRLELMEYANMTLSALRTKAAEYYVFNKEFILNDYKDSLNVDERHYFETKIQSNDYWINQTILSEEEINDYVNLLKKTPKIRRINYLKKVIKENQMNSLGFKREAEELKFLTKEIKGENK